MHLIRIALSSLALSSLQAVRSGGTSGSRATSSGCTQASPQRADATVAPHQWKHNPSCEDLASRTHG
eukprot:4515178-Pleurochrysis_carterae.AAC.1